MERVYFMGVSVAEYLGQRADIQAPSITPLQSQNVPCPFMTAECTKVAQGNKPVCSVRQTDGTLWIVCRNRLCATRKDIYLSSYQIDILFEAAKCVFGNHLTRNDIYVNREVPIPVVGGNYSADFIMLVEPARALPTGQSKVVLEIQGGGETSNTGQLTGIVRQWEQSGQHANSMLSQVAANCNPIITNAWRRQQEQFLVKGNIAQQTGGGIIFCVGSPIFDYLHRKLQNANLPNLRTHNWTLALIAFNEDISSAPAAGPIPLIVDNSRTLFTNYVSFTQALINQGDPAPGIFNEWGTNIRRIFDESPTMTVHELTKFVNGESSDE